MTPLADAHAALSSIVAALRGPEYLGDDSRKRLLIHAGVVRRGLELAEQPVDLLNGWTIKGLFISVCCVCVARGEVDAPPDALRTDGYCERHLDEFKAEIVSKKASA